MTAIRNSFFRRHYCYRFSQRHQPMTTTSAVATATFPATGATTRTTDRVYFRRTDVSNATAAGKGGGGGGGVSISTAAVATAAAAFLLFATCESAPNAARLDGASATAIDCRIVEEEEEEEDKGAPGGSSKSEEKEDEEDETTLILNWSGTHAVQVRNDSYWEPESVEEVERVVKECHERGRPVRPIGSALSPNGIAFQPGGMIGLSNLDRVVAIEPISAAPSSSGDDNDDDRKWLSPAPTATVTVQAGARVSQVVDALRSRNLTLPNLASIAEQQMGGFVQVGAHGTGRLVSPVDQYVTKLKMVTPGMGTVTLTREDDGDLFELAKVGLGCLGVVVEITMECVPAHKLVERTFVLSRKEAKEQVDALLKRHKHVRYMWIPHTDAVVVVTNDPEDSSIAKEEGIFQSSSSSSWFSSSSTSKMGKKWSEKERFEPLTKLLAELTKDSAEPFTTETMAGMGFGELRDALLAAKDPLDIEHVKRCNEAEAEFWRRSEGMQTKPSDELLQFDCGGQVRCCLHAFTFIGLGSLLCLCHLVLILELSCCRSILKSNGSGKYAFLPERKRRMTGAIWRLWRISCRE